eukprot:TRINITY_DN8278_c0_g2_i1.p1 TRINITY_DN8278_c0_g2~~TRINITY_DN8278_c0_g2_i1.p1  ORF type:complete len:376 (-),score=36.00 TRINITY_DN8278_c0_g2_i1:140-1267(-)
MEVERVKQFNREQEQEEECNQNTISFLSSFSLRQYLDSKPPSHVVTLQTEDKLSYALKLFATHKILSAPVLDGDRFWGFIDLRDVIIALLQGCDVWQLNDENREAALYAAGNRIADTKVGTLNSQGDGRLLSCSYENVPLLDVITKVFLPQTHGHPLCHRIAVFKGDDENYDSDQIQITNIISQTDILHLLLRHSNEIQPILNMTVQQLNLIDKTVVSVPEDMPTINAYAAMIQKEVSCLGIIDHQGCLIGNLSTSNLRGLQPDQFNILSVPVQKFVQAFHQTCGWDRRFNQCNRFQQCSFARDFGVRGIGVFQGTSKEFVPVLNLKCRLTDVVKVMTEKSCHRVYLVDDQNRPQSVITLTDILQIFVQCVMQQQ